LTDWCFVCCEREDDCFDCLFDCLFIEGLRVPAMGSEVFMAVAGGREGLSEMGFDTSNPIVSGLAEVSEIIGTEGHFGSSSTFGSEVSLETEGTGPRISWPTAALIL